MAYISVAGDTSTHGGAPFDTGLSTNVKAGNKYIALKSQTGSTSNDDQYNANPHGHPSGVAANQTANAGSSNVFANNKAVHKVGDARIDGATAGPGISTVKVN